MASQRERGISWTDETWNPIRGCTRVSEGCRHCYAERVAARFSGPGQPYAGLAVRTPGGPRWTGEVRLVEEALEAPLHWRKPRRVFVNSMSDLFHEKVSDAWLDRVFGVMAACPQHQFQVLTKRPDRMRDYVRHADRENIAWTANRVRGRDHRGERVGWPLPNVWLGVSVEDQQTAAARIPLLLETHAAVRFVSSEPLLGPLDLRPWLLCPACGGTATLGAAPAAAYRPCPGCWDDVWGFSTGVPTPRLSWVICGGESGPGARPMHPAWARSLRDQCQRAGVPFHFKQWGEVVPYAQGGVVPASAPRVPLPDSEQEPAFGYRVGKHRAGRLLDGRVWDEFPRGEEER